MEYQRRNSVGMSSASCHYDRFNHSKTILTKTFNWYVTNTLTVLRRTFNRCHYLLSYYVVMDH